MSTMQRYLEQLIEDMQLAYKNREENIKGLAVTEKEKERVASKLPEHLQHVPIHACRRLEQWLGFNPDIFPPNEKWDDFQLLRLCVTLSQLLEAYNIGIEFPKGLPYRTMYDYIVKAMKMKVSSDLNEDACMDTISFCTYDTTTCSFENHCTCEKPYVCDTWIFGEFWEEGSNEYFAQVEERKRAQEREGEH